MTTYDGNELLDALRARLAARFDARAEILELAAQEELQDFLGDTAELVLVSVARSTSPAVAEALEARAQALEALAQTATVEAQVNSVLP